MCHRIKYILLLSLIFAGSALADDLGKIEEGRVYEHSLIFQNPSDSSLIIMLIRSNCDCLTVSEPKGRIILAPKEEVEIKICLDTTGLEGRFNKYLYFLTNDPARPVVRREVKGEVLRRAENILARFRSFTTGTVATAGLIDGINPCAFTVLVFFISFLSFVGYEKKQALIIGSFFILAVFLAYLLVGLGLFRFLQKLEIFTLLSQIVHFAVASLAGVLGLLSLYDFWIYRKTGDTKKIKLKLPGLVKKRIHDVVMERIDRPTTKARPLATKKLILSSLSCGFIVSLLEAVCTGQVYLPTIVFVLGISNLMARALLYLLLYNLFFIIPLIIIFIFALLGITSEQFAKVARTHLGGVKLITACLFFVLAAALLLI